MAPRRDRGRPDAIDSRAVSSSRAAPVPAGPTLARPGAGRRPFAPAAHRRVFAAFALVAASLALAGALAPPSAAGARVGEWRHAWEVVQLVQEQPPQGTPVFYFGDSTARESTVRDALWTLQLRRRAAARGKTTATVAFTLASHGQTFRMDRQLVAAMPPREPGAPPGIALIGVGPSRFIGPPVRKRPAAVQPPPAGAAPAIHPWTQHLYADRPPLPLARKHELVPRWMDRRWAGFRRWRRVNLRAAEEVIALCWGKGLRPVLVELPLDVRVVGDGLVRPLGSYRAGLRRIARRQGAEYVSLQRSSPLPTTHYWDLMHLLPPGSRAWQSRLSDQVVAMLPSENPVGLAAALAAAGARRR